MNPNFLYTFTFSNIIRTKTIHPRIIQNIIDCRSLFTIRIQHGVDECSCFGLHFIKGCVFSFFTCTKIVTIIRVLNPCRIERNASVMHREEDDGSRPDVSRSTPIVLVRKDLGSHIRRGTHFARRRSVLLFTLGTKDVTGAKVSDFENIVLEEQILWLEVPVSHTGIMEIFEALHELLKEGIDFIRLEFSPGDQGIQIALITLGNVSHRSENRRLT